MKVQEVELRLNRKIFLIGSNLSLLKRRARRWNKKWNKEDSS